jgi:hypothetical protein
MSSDLLTSTIPYVGVVVITDALAFYAAYLSFSVSRGLSVPIYRSRAIWTGILAILLGLGLTASGNVGSFIPQPYYLVAIVAVYGILYPLAIFVIFFWIDRTLAMVIRLDYLRRDLLGWRRFRFVYWAFAAAALVSYAFFSLPPPNLPSSIAIILIVAPSLLYALPLGYASIALVLGGRRTRDNTFRLHAKWFGLATASIVVVVVWANFTTDPFIGSLPYILIGYCLYKMARYLVPSHRLKLDAIVAEGERSDRLV